MTLPKCFSLFGPLVVNCAYFFFAAVFTAGFLAGFFAAFLAVGMFYLP